MGIVAGALHMGVTFLANRLLHLSVESDDVANAAEDLADALRRNPSRMEARAARADIRGNPKRADHIRARAQVVQTRKERRDASNKGEG